MITDDITKKIQATIDSENEQNRKIEAQKDARIKALIQETDYIIKSLTGYDQNKLEKHKFYRKDPKESNLMYYGVSIFGALMTLEVFHNDVAKVLVITGTNASCKQIHESTPYWETTADTATSIIIIALRFSDLFQQLPSNTRLYVKAIAKEAFLNE